MADNDKNSDWREKAIRISKYDPAARDEEGRYTKDDWTSYTDIGSEFNGIKLTIGEYLTVEKKYIDAARMFFEFNSCDLIKVSNLAKFDFDQYYLSDKNEVLAIYENLKNGANVLPADLGIIIKLILRGYVWMELFCSSSPDTAVRFGYDLYMYFNSKKDLGTLLEITKSKGLYVD
jgi:hypothetical protein